MAELIERVGAIDFTPRRLPPLHSIVHAIINQQLSGRAAETIRGRFYALFEEVEFPHPEAILSLHVESLRGAGLSRAKTIYIRDVAQKALDRVLPTLEECDALSDEELIERLTTIKGVGRWTVEMLLIFNLGRPDILPVHDLGIRKGFQIVYRKRAMPKPRALDKFGQRWSPYRTTAARYLWRAVDLAKVKR